MAVVVRGTPRTDLAIVDALAKLGSTTVHEAQGRIGMLHHRLRPIFTAAIAGNALTCEVAPGDNLSVYLAIEQAKPGDILVVTPTSACGDGFLGDLLTTSLIAHGVRGAILDAGVRDVSVITEMNFPVWSKCISSQGTVKETLGNVQTPIVIANALVRPGDVIVADIDGVVVVRRERAAEILEKGQLREFNEIAKREKLSAGELALDLYSMRESLAKKGLTYIDYEESS